MLGIGWEVLKNVFFYSLLCGIVYCGIRLCFYFSFIVLVVWFLGNYLMLVFLVVEERLLWGLNGLMCVCGKSNFLIRGSFF